MLQAKRKTALLVIDTSSVSDVNEPQYWRIADELFHAGYDMEVYRARTKQGARQRILCGAKGKVLIVCCGKCTGFTDGTEDMAVYHIPCASVETQSRLSTLLFQIKGWLQSIYMQPNLGFA